MQKTFFIKPTFFAAFFLILATLAISRPLSVFADTPMTCQRIYSIHENIVPGEDYIVLTVRTGLETLDVWIQRNEGRDLFGQIISTGESQRVWEIRYRPQQNTPHTILINANHSYELDEYTTGEFFQINGTFEVQRTEPIFTQSTQAVQQRQGRDPNREYTAEWRGIEISGNGHFVDRTLLALEFLANGPEWGYDYVVNYLDYIVQDRTVDNRRIGGSVNVQTRRTQIRPVTYNHSHIAWYSSLLVHEAIHVRQYLETREARQRWLHTHQDRMERETEAMTLQYEYLRDVGASSWLINMARNLIGTVWWD